MDTMKKFFKYFIIFLIVYFVVSLLSFQTIKSTYKTKSFEANFDSPKIEIIESKATVTNGYVTGKITNNTDTAIIDKVLRLDFFSPRGVNVGKKFVDFNNLAPGETREFTSKFNFDNVDSIKASLVDRAEIDSSSDFSWDDLALNKTNWRIILFSVFVFFGQDIVMALPFL